MPAPTQPGQESKLDNFLSGMKNAFGGKKSEKPKDTPAAVNPSLTPATQTAPEAPKAVKKKARRKTAPAKTYVNKRILAEVNGIKIVSRSHSTSDTTTTTINLPKPPVLEQLPDMNFKVSKEVITSPRGNLKAVYKYHADGSGSTDDNRLQEHELIAKEMQSFSQKIKDAKKNGQKPVLDAFWIGDFNISPYEQLADGSVVVNQKFLDMLERAFPGGVFNIGLPSYAVIKTRGALDENGESLGLSPLNQQSEKDGERNFDAKTVVVHIKFNEDGEPLKNDAKKIVEDKLAEGIEVKTFDGSYTGLKDHPYALLEDEGIIYAAWGNMSTQGFKGFKKPSDKYVDAALENGNLKKTTIEAGVNAVRAFAFLLSQNGLPLFDTRLAEVKMDAKQQAEFDTMRQNFTLSKDNKVSVPFSKAFSYIMLAKRNVQTALETSKKELEKKIDTPEYTNEVKQELLRLEGQIATATQEVEAENKVLVAMLTNTLTAWFATPEFQAMKATLKKDFGNTPEEEAKTIKKIIDAMLKPGVKAPFDPFLKELDGQTTAGYMPWVNNIKEAIDNAMVDELQAESSARLLNAIHKTGKIGYLVETEAYVAKSFVFYEMPDDALDLSEIKEDSLENHHHEIAKRIAAKISEYYPNDSNNKKQALVSYDDELYYINVEDNDVRWIPRPPENMPTDLQEYNILKQKCVSGCVAGLVELENDEEIPNLDEVKDKKRITFSKNITSNTWWIHCNPSAKNKEQTAIQINHAEIIQLLESELKNEKPFIKNLASLDRINGFLQDLKLTYTCSDMRIQNANSTLEDKDKDMIFNIVGITVRGSKDEGHTKALEKAITNMMGEELDDEKNKLFELDEAFYKKPIEEYKTESTPLPSIPEENVTPVETVLTDNAAALPMQPMPAEMTLASSEEDENEPYLQSLLDSPVNPAEKMDQFLLQKRGTFADGSVVTFSNSGSSSSGSDYGTSTSSSSSSYSGISTAYDEATHDSAKQPYSSIGFSGSSSSSSGVSAAYFDANNNSASSSTDVHGTRRARISHKRRATSLEGFLSQPDFDKEDSFVVNTPKDGYESGDDLNEDYFRQVQSERKKEPRPSAPLPRPVTRPTVDEFPEITSFRISLKILKDRQHKLNDTELFQKGSLIQFLDHFDKLNVIPELDKLDVNELSLEERRDIRQLCIHAGNAIFESKVTETPWGAKLDDLILLVERLSTRPKCTKFLMALGLFFVGCLLVTALSLLSLGIPVVGAAIASTIALVTDITITTTAGACVGGAIGLVASLAAVGMFKMTKPRFSDIALSTNEIETERVRLNELEP